MPDLPDWPKSDYPDRPTAEAWARQNPKLRTSLQGQYIKLAREFLYPHRCPNCEQPMAVVDAIYVEHDDFVCSFCEAKLIFTVPIVQIGPVHWEWRLAPHQIPKKEGSDVPAATS